MSTVILAGPGLPAQAARPTAPPPMCGAAGVAHYTKVMWILMENVSYGSGAKQIPGSPSAPYLDGTVLAQCGSSSAYHAVTHPSYPNYIALTSGATQGLTSDHLAYVSADNIFAQVDPEWKSYEEYMPAPCDHVALTGNADTTQYYVGRHNPAASYSAPPIGGSGGDCRSNDVALGSSASGPLVDDVSQGTLPRFSLVTPGLCNDMHLLPSGVQGCSDPVKGGDTWLASWLPVLTSGADYDSGNLVIDIIWDEGRGGTVPHGGDCITATSADCIVPNVVVAPFTPHRVSSVAYSHYSVLRTTERILGLSYLAHAGDASTNDMCAEFNLC